MALTWASPEWAISAAAAPTVSQVALSREGSRRRSPTVVVKSWENDGTTGEDSTVVADACSVTAGGIRPAWARTGDGSPTIAATKMEQTQKERVAFIGCSRSGMMS
ncbi:MAG: hypothetical protein IT176_10410 [Acidobacteria bacterium]|nr:hypothetical protein [Acidobacteriota bacterium]